MGDSLWSRSADESSADIPGGDVIEEAMRRSLEDNAYSVQGFWLWQARSIQQRRRREQGRRRPRGEQDSNAGRGETTTSSGEGPRNEAEKDAEQHAEEVRAYISALLHATGYPYSEPSPEREVDTEKLEDAVVADTRGSEGASAAAPATTVLTDSVSEQAGLTRPSAPTSDEAPLKAARTETKVPMHSAAPPKSALAKLVAKAKAQHRESVADAPTVTVVPAAKNLPFPEDIPGVRTAYGSSSPAGRKRVQFIDESHSPSSVPQASQVAGEGDSDDEEFGVHLPGVHTQSSAPQHSAGIHEEGHSGTDSATASAEAEAVTAKHPSQMTRAEFLSQFKRAPRRGEIGQSAEDIAAAEELGYVMSGSRSVASRMYVDRIQRQLHEHEATKLQQQFRKVEDERMDDQLVHGLAQFIMKKKDS